MQKLGKWWEISHYKLKQNSRKYCGLTTKAKMLKHFYWKDEPTAIWRLSALARRKLRESDNYFEYGEFNILCRHVLGLYTYSSLIDWMNKTLIEFGFRFIWRIMICKRYSVLPNKMSSILKIVMINYEGYLSCAWCQVTTSTTTIFNITTYLSHVTIR